MISFIVIGKNESRNLKKCFDSIGASINKITNFHKIEVIYIDSDSSDSSVHIAKTNNNVDKIFKIKGEINSAIARNVGVEYSKGDILFLIDGDMSILPSFFDTIFEDKTNNLIYPFITGDIINIDVSNNKQTYFYKKRIEKSNFTLTTGGVFVIERNLWINNNGMDVRFKRSQDWDFSFSLSLKGIKALRLNSVICYHNHYLYQQRERFFETIFSGYEKYSGLFIRKYILRSFNMWYFLIRREYTAIILLMIIIATMLFRIEYIALIYLGLVIARNILSNDRFSILFILHRIINDFILLISIFFFYPSKKNKIYSIEKIK